jgi:uncharacterized iron-regulated protein
VLLALGCGAHAKAPIGYEFDPPPDPPARARHKTAPRPPVAPDAVARAAGTVQVIRLRDGVELSGPGLGRELLEYDALCAGEAHDSAAQHYGELWLMQRLAARAENLGLEFGVGFEMWATRYQRFLTAFNNGKLAESDFLAKTEYETRWGYPFAYYRPLLEGGRALGLSLVALNAPHELTEHIAEGGLDSLTPSETRSLPELDLDDPAHRADFERRMKGHPGLEPGDLTRYYTAQVVWDETMAATSNRWLDAHTPTRRLLIIAGQAHCQRSAIPARIERRGPRHVAAILLASEPVPQDAQERYDYSLVVSGSAP